MLINTRHESSAAILAERLPSNKNHQHGIIVTIITDPVYAVQSAAWLSVGVVAHTSAMRVMPVVATWTMPGERWINWITLNIIPTPGVRRVNQRALNNVSYRLRETRI